MAFFCAFSADAFAQDEEYYNYAWWSCDLTGHQTKWHILRFKEGLSWLNNLKHDGGDIIFSDDCIEISCNSVQMHFPVAQYKKISDRIFCVTRNGEDDFFDYIEVVEGEGVEKGTYRFMMAKLDPDGTMQNTKLFICQPVKLSSGKTLEEARFSNAVSSGKPVQVR